MAQKPEKLQNIDILNDNNIVKALGKIEKPLNTMGFKVYFKIGIAVTRFGKNKEEKTKKIRYNNYNNKFLTYGGKKWMQFLN